MRRRIGFLITGLIVVGLVPHGTLAAAKEVGKRKIQWTALPGLGSAYTDPFIPSRQKSWEAACEKQPYAVQNVTGDPAADQALKIPAPPGTWSDVTVRIPARVAGLVPVGLSVSMKPTIDWDLFICKVVKGRYTFVGNNLNAFGGTSGCTDPAGFFGCPENPKVGAKPGETFVLRAWNFSDVNPTLVGELSFLAVPRR